MFRLFKKKKKKKSNSPAIIDIDGHALEVGDRVQSLRYELGECVLLSSDKGLMYESVETGRQVSWVKMIDASTERQKVKKVQND